MKKVLLVDDENLILYSLSTTLRSDGYDVTTASNGASALHALNGGDFEVCILDVCLPDSNGLDLMRFVRNRSPRTGIIIMTATDLTERQLADIRESGGQFIPKPFDLEQIRSTVADLSATAVKTAPSEALCAAKRHPGVLG